MNAPSPWLLVFDLDGTLIDSSLDLCLSVNAAMAHVDAPELTHAQINRFIGDGAAMLVRRALECRDGPDTSAISAMPSNERFDAAFAFFLSYYSKHKLDNICLYDGVLSALQTLRSRNPDQQMAVLTNKPVRPSREIYEALGLTEFFFANYGGDSFARKKPDPGGLIFLMREARELRRSTDRALCPPGGVVMIGDSEADVLTGRRAETLTLGCRYGLAPQALELTRPDLLCDSPAEWPSLLAGIYNLP